LVNFTEKYNTQPTFLAAIRWMLANIQFRIIRVVSDALTRKDQNTRRSRYWELSCLAV